MIKMLHFWLLGALEATFDRSSLDSDSAKILPLLSIVGKSSLAKTLPLLSMILFSDLHVGMGSHSPVAGLQSAYG